MSVKQFSVTQISSTEDRAKLLAAVKEVSNAFARIEGEADYIKETTKKLATDFKLPKKLVTKLVRVWHKKNYDEVVATEEQFQQLYESLTSPKKA